MPLETATYISDLNASNPAATDAASQGDDHIRLIKTVSKNSFPNINGAVSATDEDLSSVGTGVVSVKSIDFGKAVTPDTTSKLQSTAVGKVAATGRFSGNGFVPTGAIVDFPKLPPNLGSEWLECDGSVLNISDFPELGAYLGATFGGNGTSTFGLPPAKDTGRYRRSRTATLAGGTTQANTLRNHTHAGTVDAAGIHTHTATSTDSGHAHGGGSAISKAGSVTGGSIPTSGGNVWVGTGSLNTDTDHAHITTTLDGAGEHQHTFTTNQTGDSTETRPETLVVVTCIKT